MKKYLLILTLLTSFLAHSQLNRGGMRNSRQNQMNQTPRKAPEPNFQVEKYLGIVIYDIEKAAKKSSIKLSSEEGKKFKTLLTKYNKEIKDIRRINSFTLRSTKEMMENFQKNAQKNGDFSDRTKVQKKMVENLTPISETLRTKDRALDKSIKEILSEKQYKKWIKYNRKMYKVFPKDEEKKE
ncbi:MULTISPECIES: hypothetical protein [unclassified Polaribacter]|uniref:hypothetical protein n=1 Tax=unclassified Polaribacter TaxID=196858 RepID=UPI000068C597|nr:hypothetical protein [Polaribacter sp. MED152]EAQ42808.1 hypothetical protein MED152_08800 [Polaribacter sp. MED152]